MCLVLAISWKFLETYRQGCIGNSTVHQTTPRPPPNTRKHTGCRRWCCLSVASRVSRVKALPPGGVGASGNCCCTGCTSGSRRCVHGWRWSTDGISARQTLYITRSVTHLSTLSGGTRIIVVAVIVGIEELLEPLQELEVVLEAALD